MLVLLDKIKRVMHSCSLQLEMTMFRVVPSYLLSVISITQDERVKTVITTAARLTLQYPANDPTCQTLYHMSSAVLFTCVTV